MFTVNGPCHPYQPQGKRMTHNPAQSPTGGMKTSTGTASKSAQNLDSQSVAGEEDPGASLDMSAGMPVKPSGGTVPMPAGGVNPGDDAPEGTPGTGEGLCRECGGSGRMGDASCPSCNGSGKVIVGIGGA